MHVYWQYRAFKTFATIRFVPQSLGTIWSLITIYRGNFMEYMHRVCWKSSKTKYWTCGLTVVSSTVWFLWFPCSHWNMCRDFHATTSCECHYSEVIRSFFCSTQKRICTINLFGLHSCWIALKWYNSPDSLGLLCEGFSLTASPETVSGG